MAYTGILLRGGAHPDIMNDPPIHREIAITDKGLVVGYDNGDGVVNFTLDYSILAKIAPVAADGTVDFEGLSTSDLPIVFDGTGDIKVTDDGIILRDVHTLSSSLDFIKSVNSLNMVITDNADPETTKTLIFDDIIRVSAITAEMISTLEQLNGSPVLANPSTTTVDITNVQGTTIVVDETEASLGTLTADGTLTFSTEQASGARVYAYNYDVSKNRSKRTSILIP